MVGKNCCHCQIIFANNTWLLAWFPLSIFIGRAYVNASSPPIKESAILIMLFFLVHRMVTHRFAHLRLFKYYFTYVFPNRDNGFLFFLLSLPLISWHTAFSLVFYCVVIVYSTCSLCPVGICAVMITHILISFYVDQCRGIYPLVHLLLHTALFFYSQ